MDPASASSEKLYIEYVETGDRDALESLVAMWHDRAYAIARCICRESSLAEEAVQDAFMKLMSRKRQFNPEGSGTFRSWFLTVVTNCARMARRSERRAQQKKDVNPTEYSRRKGLDERVKGATERSHMRHDLEKSLDGIEERWRVPVVLHFLEGMQQKELASMLGVSQQMVSRRIERGLELLRVRLAQAGFSVSVIELGKAIGEEGVYAAREGSSTQLIQSLDQLGSGAMEQSARAAVAGSKLPTIAAAAVLVLGVGGGALAWKYYGDRQTERSSPTGEREPTKEWSWRFDEGLPKGLIKRQGGASWKSDAGLAGSGALVNEGAPYTILGIPDDIPHQSLVTFHLRFETKTADKSFIVRAAMDAIADQKTRLYEPLEVLDRAEFFEMTIFIDKDKKYCGYQTDGRPLQLVEWWPKQEGEAVPLEITVRGGAIDNLSIRSADQKTIRQWEDWRANRVRYDIYKGFDTEFFWQSYGFGGSFLGPRKIAKGRSIDGTAALHCKGSRAKPVIFGTPSPRGKGIAITEFDWHPLETEAVQRDALNIYFGPHPKKGQTRREIAEKLARRKQPNQLIEEWRDKPIGDDAPTLNRWHKAVFLNGMLGSYCIIDGKIHARWEDPRKLYDVGVQILRLNGECLIDNYRLRHSDRPFDQILKDFTVDP